MPGVINSRSTDDVSPPGPLGQLVWFSKLHLRQKTRYLPHLKLEGVPVFLPLEDPSRELTWVSTAPAGLSLPTSDRV